MTKPFKPTEKDRKQVSSMAAFGTPQENIARVMGIAPKTLRLHFRDELDNGSTIADAAVAQSLYNKAIGNGPQAVTACIFWAKTRMGWKEKQVYEHTGAGGAPLTFRISKDDAKL